MSPREDALALVRAVITPNEWGVIRRCFHHMAESYAEAAAALDRGDLLAAMTATSRINDESKDNIAVMRCMSRLAASAGVDVLDWLRTVMETPAGAPS